MNNNYVRIHISESIAFQLVEREVDSACDAFPPMASPHEGWAIINEELYELWDEIRKKPALRSKRKMREEAVQVAAMAIRFLVDICKVEAP